MQITPGLLKIHQLNLAQTDHKICLQHKHTKSQIMSFRQATGNPRPPHICVLWCIDRVSIENRHKKFIPDNFVGSMYIGLGHPKQGQMVSTT